MIRFAPPLLALTLLTGCAVGDRTLESVHQPVVADGAAAVPGCPDWSHAVGGEHESQSSNFGCATNSNLAMMVADPADLLHGRGDGTSSAETAVKAVKGWQNAPATTRYWKPNIPISEKLDPSGQSDALMAAPAGGVEPNGGPK